MSICQCVLRVHKDNGTATLRVEGRATMNQSPAVRRFAEKCLSSGVAALQLDLSRCTYMDSTFLGTLLHLERATEKAKQSGFALVAPSPECCQLLRQMGLEELFPVVPAKESVDDTWTPLSQEPEDRDLFRWNVVQAHQELGRLKSPAGEEFRSVATALVAEINSRR